MQREPVHGLGGLQAGGRGTCTGQNDVTPTVATRGGLRSSGLLDRFLDLADRLARAVAELLRHLRALERLLALGGG